MNREGLMTQPAERPSRVSESGSLLRSSCRGLSLSRSTPNLLRLDSEPSAWEMGDGGDGGVSSEGGLSQCRVT